MWARQPLVLLTNRRAELFRQRCNATGLGLEAAVVRASSAAGQAVVAALLFMEHALEVSTQVGRPTACGDELVIAGLSAAEVLGRPLQLPV